MIGLARAISADEPFLTDISVAHILASSSKICQKFATCKARPSGRKNSLLTYTYSVAYQISIKKHKQYVEVNMQAIHI